MTSGLLLFTAFHTILGLLALMSGIVVIYMMASRKNFSRWIPFFLATTIATSVTGFFFPFKGMTPAIIVGIAAMPVLAAALATWPSRGRSGAGRVTFLLSLVVSEYLLAFVGVAQAFSKIPVLHQAAPTLKEPPFGIAQGAVFLLFVLLAVICVRQSGRT